MASNAAKFLFSFFLVKKIWYSIRKLSCPISSTIPDTYSTYREFTWGKLPEWDSHEFPNIIWSFWSGETSPSAEACQETWKANKSGFSINIITPKTIRYYLPDLPEIPSLVPVQLKSDLIRLSILEKHGGIWLDYSTLITKPLSWVQDCLNRHKAEMLVFYNEFFDEYRKSPSRPIIENGFIAARSNSRFISAWKTEFQECILSDDYRTHYIKHENYNQIIGNFLTQDSAMLSYLCCYVAAQKIMLEGQQFRIAIINAEDDYYYLYYKTSPPRKQWRFAEELLLKSLNEQNLPRIIKITGGHRRILDEYIKFSCYKHHSLMGRLL